MPDENSPVRPGKLLFGAVSSESCTPKNGDITQMIADAFPNAPGAKMTANRPSKHEKHMAEAYRAAPLFCERNGEKQWPIRAAACG
jgi:hypothetical protein